MIELSPVLIANDKLQREGVDYDFEKLPDKSVVIRFKKHKLTLIIMPALIIGSRPRVFANGSQLSYYDYDVETHQGRPGVSIFLPGLPVKRLDLVPRVLAPDEEKAYMNKKRKEAMKKYEREHMNF